MRNKVKFLTETGKKRMLSQCGIIYDRTTANMLRVHNKNESWGHFLTKAVLFKLFRDKGYTVLLEAETDHGVVDCYILELGLALEVVSSLYPKKRASTKELYRLVKDILVVAVPEYGIDAFCKQITEQVHIWL
jgi:hypothetical protein